MVHDSRGAGSFRDNSNTVFNFVATNTDLYQLDGGAFTSRKGSLTGTQYRFLDIHTIWKLCNCK